LLAGLDMVAFTTCIAAHNSSNSTTGAQLVAAQQQEGFGNFSEREMPAPRDSAA
jgi:hypothetical protein